MPSTAANISVPSARRSDRFRVDFPIKLFFRVQQRRCVLQGKSHDLSHQGMAIYIPAELRVGQFVQIEFVLPHTNQRLGINGVVRDRDGFRCGIEFQDLTSIDQEALSLCCKKLALGATAGPSSESVIRKY
jgi:c-di-GMP-binding flagellar brake protein YcgR